MNIPNIRRARGWRLYTEDGRRLVDLWQHAGRAVLGHKPSCVARELKNAAEAGVLAPFPSHWTRRLAAGLAMIFPGRAFRFYPDRAGLDEALRDSCPGAEPRRWLPFMDDANPLACPFPGDALFLAVLPFPLAPETLVLPPAADERFPPSPLLSPALLAATCRAVHTLLHDAPARQRAAGHIITLFDRNADASRWKRQGIYLHYAGAPASDAEYDALFTAFLAAGFLIPPGPDAPLILPGECSPGEERALLRLLTLAPE